VEVISAGSWTHEGVVGQIMTDNYTQWPCTLASTHGLSAS